MHDGGWSVAAGRRKRKLVSVFTSRRSNCLPSGAASTRSNGSTARSSAVLIWFKGKLKKKRHVTSEFGGEFVIWEAIDGHRPNRHSLDRLPPVPASTAEIEHREIIIGIQREGLFIGVDSLCGLAKIAVCSAKLKPAHGVRLDVLGLFAQDWQTLFKPTEKVEGGAETVAVVTAHQIVGLPKTGLSLDPVRIILRPVPKSIP